MVKTDLIAITEIVPCHTADKRRDKKRGGGAEHTKLDDLCIFCWRCVTKITQKSAKHFFGVCVWCGENRRLPKPADLCNFFYTQRWWSSKYRSKNTNKPELKN